MRALATRHATCMTTRSSAQSASSALSAPSDVGGCLCEGAGADLGALPALFEASGYRLTSEQLDAIMAGDEAPDRPIDFIAIVGRYFQLTEDEELALLFQVAYDIIRLALGPEILASVFGSSASRAEGRPPDV